MSIKILALLMGLLGLTAATGVVFERDAMAREAHVSHYGDGTKRESTYFEAGKRNGPTQRWYPDGTLKSEGLYAGGLREGEWLCQNPDGSLDTDHSGFYANGKLISG